MIPVDIAVGIDVAQGKSSCWPDPEVARRPAWITTTAYVLLLRDGGHA
jgi:hypothetical protein